MHRLPRVELLPGNQKEYMCFAFFCAATVAVAKEAHFLGLPYCTPKLLQSSFQMQIYSLETLGKVTVLRTTGSKPAGNCQCAVVDFLTRVLHLEAFNIR